MQPNEFVAWKPGQCVCGGHSHMSGTSIGSDEWTERWLNDWMSDDNWFGNEPYLRRPGH